MTGSPKGYPQPSCFSFRTFSKFFKKMLKVSKLHREAAQDSVDSFPESGAAELGRTCNDGESKRVPSVESLFFQNLFKVL